MSADAEELASLREQLDDIEHETRTSSNLARKYWALWRERGRQLESARRIAVALEQENAHLQQQLAQTQKDTP